MTVPVTVIGGTTRGHFITVPWRKRTCVKRLTSSDPEKGCGIKYGRGRLCKSFMAFESSAIISHVCPSTSSNSRSTVNYECSDNLQSMGDGRLEGASARLSLVWTNVMRRETLNAMAVKCSSLECCIKLQAFCPFYYAKPSQQPCYPPKRSDCLSRCDITCRLFSSPAVRCLFIISPQPVPRGIFGYGYREMTLIPPGHRLVPVLQELPMGDLLLQTFLDWD